MIDVSQPIIVSASIAAGHDGAAEVSVALRYPNGAERTMSLPYDAVDAALDTAGISTLDQLVGEPWTMLLADPAAHSSCAATAASPVAPAPTVTPTTPNSQQRP